MLAIAGGKGGCGKTTTALGLAQALVSRGYEPLVVDGDCDMPDIHHYTGVGRVGGVNALAEGQSVTEVAVHASRFPGVSFITGGRRKRLGTALRRLQTWDGPVLVDCPAGISPDALVPLRCADTTVIVSTDQPQCLEDTERTIVVADRFQDSTAGVLLRKTGARFRPNPSHLGVRDCPVLGRVPTVDNPLENHRVRTEVRSVSRTVYPPTSREQGSSRGRPDSHTSSVSV